ncbi:MAG: hypothetical protein QOF76_607, partial [Solirubrobacteraceae bacterium]|nr:hypothetical protein [Solirubrobacteraceae bacterium]
MSLRPLLAHLNEHPEATRLAEAGGDAFVSVSLRPALVAALADRDPDRATLVVAGDDRHARELAADVRAWLKPRRVGFYPSRGVAYESHLTPPPHLTGLRVAALDALSETAPVIVVSAVALSEKVPDPSLRPHSLKIAKGDLIDLDDFAGELVAAGYERVEQVEDRGQFAMRGGILDLYPATEDRAVRVELFDIEVESLRWFSTFTQRSLGDTDAVEIAPAAELAPEHREAAELAALDDERPDIADILPVESFREFLDLVPADAQILIAAGEDVEPAVRDNWQDVCTAFHDEDAGHLYVHPDRLLERLGDRAKISLSGLDSGQPFEFRAQAADIAARSLAAAEPELEKLTRSDYTTVVAWTSRGAGERAAYNLGRLKAQWGADAPTPLRFVEARLRDGFIAPQFRLAIIPEHRLIQTRNRRQEKKRGGGRGALRSFADLRTGDIIVHEDHGLARFAGFDT